MHDPATAETGVIKRAREGRRGQERFSHEVRTLERLQTQSGVLALLDRDDGEEPRWMVMEVAQPLATHLGGDPDLHAVVSAVAEVADALLGAKALDIAHRDIKPDNLFYARGRAVVGDFGLATGHEVRDLTAVGGKVGPANFNAPETNEWTRDTDPFAADLYSLAKTLWVLAAGQPTRYPPPGTLLIRQEHTDLSRHVGKTADDLARLLELATEHRPALRPDMETFLRELRLWMSLHSPGTTPRPDPDRRPSAFDIVWGARALEIRGPEEVVDRRVQLLLDACRSLHEGHSRVVEHPSPEASALWEEMSGGDPDWSPDVVVAKRLQWSGVATARLVAIGVLEGHDNLRYRLRWQVRPAGSQQWTSTWTEERRVRMRLPSDGVEQRDLCSAAGEHAPTELTTPKEALSEPVASGLRQLAKGAAALLASERAEREALEQRISARNAAATQARGQLEELWRDLTRVAEEVVADDDDIEIQAESHSDTWFLRLGESWRLVVRLFDAPSHLTDLLVGGTVVVEGLQTGHDDQTPRSQVGNVAALMVSAGDPTWQLLRFRSNDWGQPHVSTTEARFDGAGGVDINVLEAHFASEQQTGMRLPSLIEVERGELSVEALLELLRKEGEALGRGGAPSG